MNQNAKLFWASVDTLNFSKYSSLLSFFGDLQAAAENISVSALQEMGWQTKSIESTMKKIKEFDAEKTQKIFEKSRSHILFFEDENFPENLKNISDPPIFLFVKGKFQNFNTPFAVVGTRTPSADGKWAVENLLPELVAKQMTIVSGMAAGIDTLAHKTALQNGGKTVAFWGTGIDQIYPAQNRELAEKICENGCIFSEFPLGTKPLSYNFPRRNRLVSGFSEGVLIVEGKQKSGSLITADFALEQGKEIFCVAGSIRSPLSEGPNRLIQQGAKLVHSASDILEDFGISTEKKSVQNFSPRDEQEKKLYEKILFSPVSFDVLVQETGLSSAEVSTTLMMMTLAGAIEEAGNGHFIRR